MLDAEDPLATFRDRFLDDGSTIYLDGNSMGRLPKAALPRLQEMAEHEWGRILVRGWTESGWMESPLRVGDRIGELIGASPGEVLVADTTSVGLFRLMTSVMRARPQRRVIVTERSNFPTDLYIAQGVAELLGCEIRAVERGALRESLDGDTALLLLTEVDFRSGERHDMGALTGAAHAAGALTLWDLSHSAGAVEIRLNHHRVDLAVGCGYKYLNGGPGSPAYLYVATALQEELRNPIQGWLGHDNPFLFDSEYRRAPGMRGWMSGSPPVLAIGALDIGIDIQLEAGAHAVGEKAALLTEVFIRLADERLGPLGFEVATPASSERRGAQVSLRHSDGLAIVRAVADRGVIGDFRPPDMCRFGLAPLYTRFVDLWDAVERIAEVVERGTHRQEKYREEVAIP
ncbi:MAG: kynureninase [Candidatus Dormiibacterota bacterium]